MNRAILLSILLGLFCGLVLFTLIYARATSYLSDNPEACLNCHIMRDQYDAWIHSSHRKAATCNSCHTPKNVVGKYATKAVNGWNHGLSFTTGRFPEPIRIRNSSRKIALKNCVYCHQEMVSFTRAIYPKEDLNCISCHGNVGHRNKQ